MATKKKSVKKKVDRRIEPKVSASSGNGRAVVKVNIPPVMVHEYHLRLVGTSPLLVNNKFTATEVISRMYQQGGKTVEQSLTMEEAYLAAFYVMPESKFQPPSPKGIYGIPASGIKKCACSAIRTTGTTDNATIGLITKSFWVFEDAAGLCRLYFKGLHKDERGVSLKKSTPQLRWRPMFEDWYVDIRVGVNGKVLTPEMIVNLFNHAGVYVGLCEMRMEKKQGSCGGFRVETRK